MPVRLVVGLTGSSCWLVGVDDDCASHVYAGVAEDDVCDGGVGGDADYCVECSTVPWVESIWDG